VKGIAIDAVCAATTMLHDAPQAAQTHDDSTMALV
jgi:hypothetical protein